LFNFEILSKWAIEKPSSIAFADEEHILTFAQLNSMARKTAAVLSQQGITQGQLVCISLPSYLEWTTALALHLMGVTTMSKIGTAAFSPQISPDWLICLQPDPRISADKTIVIDEVYLERIKASVEMHDFPGYGDEEQPARLFATSGTSGESKYVAVTSSGLQEYVTRGGTHDFFGEEPVLSLFPLGMGTTYGRAIRCLHEGRAFFSCGFSDYRLPKILRLYPIKTLLGSPLQISAFLDAQLNTGSELAHLANIILSGSAPSDQLITRIRSQLNCKIYNGYGSTEGGSITMKEITDNDLEGSPINPVVELQIVDEDDQILAPEQTGLIRYRRPGMSTSYYKNPQATAEFFKNGYFYPGDLGYVDSIGHLVLAGRTSEVINLGGVKVNPEKIDEVAIAQLGVIDCAAFAVMAPSGVEQLAIAVISDPDFNLENFTKVMSKKLPWALKFIVPTNKIPRSESGKVLRHELQEEFRRQNG